MSPSSHPHDPSGSDFHPDLPSCPVTQFLSGLFETGQVVVARGVELKSIPATADALLREAFCSLVTELGEATVSPAHGSVEEPRLVYHSGMAHSGLRCLYRICLAVIDRTLTEVEVIRHCSVAMPVTPQTPAEALSADICLRHLPEVYHMAHRVSETDPLLNALIPVATRFPLSSVGIPLTPGDTQTRPQVDLNLDLLRSHAGLWQLYIDRILERQDVARLEGAEDVRRKVLDAIGSHAALAPRLAAHLLLQQVLPS